MTKSNERLYRLAKLSNNEKAISYFESMITVADMKNLSKEYEDFSTKKYSCETRLKDGKISYHFFDRINGKIVSVKKVKNIIG